MNNPVSDLFLPLAKYNRIGLDTETTGVTYNDRPVGLSYATPDGHKKYLRWGHRDGGNNCDLAQVINWARHEWRADLLAVFHNASFDLRMMSYVGLPTPAKVEDTNIVAALLNELEPSFSLGGLGQAHVGRTKSDDKLNQYCAAQFGGMATRRAQAQHYWKVPGDVIEEYAEDDADLTLALYDKLRPQLTLENLDDIYRTECQLIPILLRMHLEGVRIDPDKAEAVKAELKVKLTQKVIEWESLTGTPLDTVNSTQKLAKVFKANGLPVDTTDTFNEKTQEYNPSITKEWLEMIDHPIAKLVRSLRQIQHYSGTFIDNYLLSNIAADGCVHGEFHQVKNDRYGTVSGRFSSGGALNLQNIPARDEEWAPLIRGLFVPMHKWQRWMKSDYSQIEYRFFAHYAGGAMRDAYNNDPNIDFHDMVCQLVFGEITKPKRKRAKNVNFAKLYGAGVKRLAETMGTSVEEARELVEHYDSRIPQAKSLYDQADRLAAKRGYIITWGGRKRRFPKLKNVNRYYRTHIALNALLQGSAADLMKKAMVDVDDYMQSEARDEASVHMTVHDELDGSVPNNDRGADIARDVKRIKEQYQLTVPVLAEVELGTDWGHTSKLEL